LPWFFLYWQRARNITQRENDQSKDYSIMDYADSLMKDKNDRFNDKDKIVVAVDIAVVEALAIPVL
jgi:hypothetical protein